MYFVNNKVNFYTLYDGVMEKLHKSTIAINFLAPGYM